MAEIGVFLHFYSFFWFYTSKNNVDFGLKSVIRWIKLEKYADFSPKSRKLWSKLKISILWEKFLIIFFEVWTEKAWMVSFKAKLRENG